MPIKAENRGRYPPNWADLRRQVLERAGHRCENCGVGNHWFIHRDALGLWFVVGFNERLAMLWPAQDSIVAAPPGAKLIEIVLTIAHLEHDELETQDISRLRAWCQKCHLTYDAKHHAQNAAQTRHARKAIGELFP